MSLNLNTEKLKCLVNDWFTEQSPIPTGVTVSISLSFEKTKVEATYTGSLDTTLNQFLTSENFKIANINPHRNLARLRSCLCNIYHDKNAYEKSLQKYLENTSEHTLRRIPNLGPNALSAFKQLLEFHGFPPLRPS